jgi:cob(I)alamin adenosyltransferase
MKIYTRTGDEGETALFGGARVMKDDARVEAYGTVDELNSLLGAVVASQPGAEIQQVLVRVQAELFQLGAELACVPGKEDKLGILLVTEREVEVLERDIDEAERHLPPLVTFVLPGGTLAASLLHVARTVCRRAERTTLAVARTSALRPLVLVYLNRLADLLFVQARWANLLANQADVPWNPRGREAPSPRSAG